MQVRDIRRRLQRVGVEFRHAELIASRVSRQIRLTGPENTARYLKLVGQSLLYFMYGTGERPAWVRTRHGFPTFLWELRSYPEGVLVRVSKLARVIRLTSVTKKQMEKVIQGVVAPFTGSESALTEMTRLVSLGMSRTGLESGGLSSPEPILIGRQFSKTMSTGNRVRTQGAPPFLESLRVLKAWPEVSSLPWAAGSFSPLLPKSFHQLLAVVEPADRVCGEIHASQEGGAKLRMYASPYTAIQCVMAPVHDWFVAYLKQLPMNCTWDQLRGALNAQARLREGFVFSLDLSTATCRFPLSVQTEMARRLGMPEEAIVAIEAVSRGKWKVGSEIRGPKSSVPSFIAWVVGQPLGMRFSMSMFSLAHNLLIAGISAELGFNPWDSFNVLGDDVVIYHREVAEVYSQLVQACGIPISWNKSHSSDLVAEFAGATITRDLVVRPGQFREVTPKNVLSLCEEYGVLEHETSALSQKVQKLHLFSKGLYTPSEMEYSAFIKANTLLQVGWTDLPRFATKAPRWSMKINLVIREQLAELSARTGVKPLIVPKAESAKQIFSLRPSTDNMKIALAWYKDTLNFQDPLLHALYCFWIGTYNDVVDGLIGPDDCVGALQSALDMLHSFLYLPPRAKDREAARFKRLLSAVLPRIDEVAA